MNLSFIPKNYNPHVYLAFQLLGAICRPSSHIAALGYLDIGGGMYYMSYIPILFRVQNENG
jgi:hypothetical protein